jgi:hypothetical protein
MEGLPPATKDEYYISAKPPQWKDCHLRPNVFFDFAEAFNLGWQPNL